MEGRRRKRDAAGQRHRRRDGRDGVLHGDRHAQPLDRRGRRGFGRGPVSSSRPRFRPCRGASRNCRVIESVAVKTYTLSVVPRKDRRHRARQRRHSHRLCGDHRGRRGLQQRPHRIAGARLGAGQPARARLYPRRGGAASCSVSSRSRSRWQFRSGCWLSQGIVELIARFHSNESFQIPAVIGSRTYVVAVAIVVAAAAASAYIVRRRVDRLDLVAVLKTRD